VKRGIVGLLILALVLLIPLPARVIAATKWTVRAGADRENKALQALLFLPKEITVNEGDTVLWALGGSDHSIFFPADQKPPDLIIPGKAKGVLLWNPVIFLPSMQKTYDGSGPLSGGVIGQEMGLPKTYQVTFTKAGTYKYVCMFHPGMEGAVTVQAAGTANPKTQAEYTKMAVEQANAAIAKAKELRQATKPVVAGEPGKRTFTLDMVGSPKDMATFYRFAADRLEIKRGETVTWVMKDPTELHTVSFGVGNKPFDIVTVKPEPKGPPQFLVNMQTFVPAGGKVHTGKGFYNSGFILPGPPGVQSYSLTFSRSGTYEYICATHLIFGMKGTIVVK
jgi:plastocyanin